MYNTVEEVVRAQTRPGEPCLIRAPPGFGKSYTVRKLSEDPEFKERIFDADDWGSWKDHGWRIDWEKITPFTDQIIIGNSDNWTSEYHGDPNIRQIGIIGIHPDNVYAHRTKTKHGYVPSWDLYKRCVKSIISESDILFHVKNDFKIIPKKI